MQNNENVGQLQAQVAELQERLETVRALCDAAEHVGIVSGGWFTVQAVRKAVNGEHLPKPTLASARKNQPSGDDPVVAYRDPHNPRVLLCREHGERWQGVYPVTAEDLPDGGICSFGRLSSLTCGRDVLAD